MKKRMHKLCTILTASALLAMSVTVYAAEGDNTEAGFQPAEEGTVQSADTEQTQETASEQTEEKDPEENGLDSFIYIREKEDKTTEKAKVKKVTIEELKEEIDANQVPELAAVVFQFSDEEFETEALTENTTEFETETQSETTESESETATETETESETDKDLEIEKYPTVELSDMQKDMVYEVAELVPQTVIILNQCELEDHLVFADCKEVKAVTVLKADTEKGLKKAIQQYDLEKEYANYLQLQSEKKSASKGQARTTSTADTSKSLAIPQTSAQPESQTSTTPSNRVAGSSSTSGSSSSGSSGYGSSGSSASGSSSTSGTTTTGQKDVTFKFEPDEVYSGEESISATYSVSSTKEITYGKVTINYDTNAMKYDDSNAEDSDALEGMTIKVIKPTDSAGTEGKIVIEFSSTTPKKLKGTLVDLWFNLTGNATTGQQFNISMTVDELRNGSTNLTSEVETASMVAQPDGEEEKETETPATTSTPSTTASTSASSSSTTSGSSSTTTTQNAPKTGDATNIPAMVLLMAGSAAVYIKARKRV